MNDIVISIKPNFVKLIVSGQKNYEFRKYIPKKGVSKIWIYTTSPVCRLEYMAEIDNVIIYPQQITEIGFGNDDFNKGLKKSNYAYHINHLYKINSDLCLKKLRDNFDFFAPQSYFYLNSNEKLSEYILNQKLEEIF